MRKKLLDIARHAYVKPGRQIFEQDKIDEKYCVIVRGSVKIEKKVNRFKKRDDMPPVVVRTCYDGDQFGELAWFTSMRKQEKKVKGPVSNNKEQLRLIRRPTEDIFEPKMR